MNGATTGYLFFVVTNIPQDLILLLLRVRIQGYKGVW